MMRNVRLELSSGVVAMVEVVITPDDLECIKDMNTSEEKEYWEDRAMEYLESSIEDFKMRR